MDKKNIVDNVTNNYQNYQIVIEARKWLNTPFKHQGRVQHQGCDCVGLVIGVFKKLGLRGYNNKYLHENDMLQYGRIADGVMLQSKLQESLDMVEPQNAQYGDILLMRFRSDPQHVAILGDYNYGTEIINKTRNSIIHCYAETGKVVEHRLDNLWKNRIVACYRTPLID